MIHALVEVARNLNIVMEQLFKGIRNGEPIGSLFFTSLNHWDTNQQ